ncbi:unnamed protein product [Caenorhabditis auriculariae]|uniref:FYVE-type domain-containing protein n=1 Tax=Caenorhabditis auriculariae TaxID=2777116 RepID=A0A8S1HGV1_9PELO|nr:unnamed protein product [Caenorhabditis auriculariae]
MVVYHRENWEFSRDLEGGIAMDVEVRQGFICPFCMVDFGDYPPLQAHVESAHGEEEEADLTDAVVQNVKEFFGKAKRGIRKLDARVNTEISNVNISGVSSSVADLASLATSAVEKAVEGSSEPKEKPQNIRIRRPVSPVPRGATRSSTEYFKKCRDQSINEMAIRTNMLIIRLDRLIHHSPKDPTKRKEFEREIVPWVDDSEVAVCPLCATKFGMTRRRHHCRLCGRVTCHACSEFLSFLSARKLTNPALAHEMMEVAAAASSLASTVPDVKPVISPSNGRRRLMELTQNATGRMMTLIGGKIQGSHSEDSSVSSLVLQDGSECLRLCVTCLADLRRREQMMDQSSTGAVVEQYNSLHDQLEELTALVPTYVRMANSVNNGETMYTLKSAEEMRQKVAAKQRNADILSKRIAEGGEAETSHLREQQMRRNIRMAALNVLQGLAGQMSPLPTEEQYLELVERHKREMARQVAEARERSAASKALPHSERLKTKSLPMSAPGSSSALVEKSPPNAKKNVADDGWTPVNTKSYNPFMEETNMLHPMFEQRDILKGYLEQAASSGRLDEVEMLERSLRELEEEMRSLGLETPR